MQFPGEAHDTELKPANGFSLVISSSTRKICWLPARKRVFRLVGLPVMITGSKRMAGSFANSSCNDLPASSSPQTPIKCTCSPNCARLQATFAAPPGIWRIRLWLKIGTGASGEIRVTAPSTNRSMFYFSLAKPEQRLTHPLKDKWVQAQVF